VLVIIIVIIEFIKTKVLEKITGKVENLYGKNKK